MPKQLFNEVKKQSLEKNLINLVNLLKDYIGKDGKIDFEKKIDNKKFIDQIKDYFPKLNADLALLINDNDSLIYLKGFIKDFTLAIIRNDPIEEEKLLKKWVDLTKNISDKALDEKDLKEFISYAKQMHNFMMGSDKNYKNYVEYLKTNPNTHLFDMSALFFAGYAVQIMFKINVFKDTGIGANWINGIFALSVIAGLVAFSKWSVLRDKQSKYSNPHISSVLSPIFIAEKVIKKEGDSNIPEISSSTITNLDDLFLELDKNIAFMTYPKAYYLYSKNDKFNFWIDLNCAINEEIKKSTSFVDKINLQNLKKAVEVFAEEDGVPLKDQATFSFTV
ncbi:MAG: hypothetical protein J0H68_02040 [Sphingobacteriia bacterium]|nr:hypothetical protein [Sphingobacteriia bacterium]